MGGNYLGNNFIGGIGGGAILVRLSLYGGEAMSKPKVHMFNGWDPQFGNHSLCKIVGPNMNIIISLKDVTCLRCLAKWPAKRKGKP